MRKKTMKQKCLAWLLSIAVAVTFVPMTAGFAFAADDDPAEPDYYVNLEKANDPNAVTGNEVKVYVNLKAPWQDDDSIVNTQIATGESMKPEIANVSCRMGVGTYGEDGKKIPGDGEEADENVYFTVDYGEGDWTEPGDYTIKVTANEDAPAVQFTRDGTDYTAKFTGTYELKLKIAADPKDLNNSKITFNEGTPNKKGEIEIPYDGKLHKLTPTITDPEGTIVDPDYYDVTYPNETTNAYRKTGKFDIVITAKEGNAGEYTGEVTKVVSITDTVTDITVYSQNGLNGDRVQKKVFKYASWGNYAKSAPLCWGYGINKWTTTYYIPVEDLLVEAGLGEAGKFNGKDLIDLWTYSEPEHYFNAPKTVGELQTYIYDASGTETKMLEVIGGEGNIPAVLVLDCETASVNPRGAVGRVAPETSTAGNMSPSSVSEISLVSMDVNGLSTSVAGATYNGKAQTPAVTVKDGDVEVPVTVTYKNNTNAGTATATITAKEDSDYYGTATKTFTIAKAANPLTVKAKTAKVKKSKVKKKAQKLAKSKVLTVSKNQGKVTYTKVSGSSKLKIAKTTGKVTVKKKTKKGTYKMKVKVTAAGNNNYKAASKTVTFKVKVK